MFCFGKVISHCKEGDLLPMGARTGTNLGNKAWLNKCQQRKDQANLTHLPKRSRVLILGADPSVYK